jgi:CheY-like chemotaxis protein
MAKAGNSLSAIMASASRHNTRSASLDYSNDFIPATNIPARASGWLSVSASSKDIMAASGSNPNPEKDPSSASRSLSEVKTRRPYQILVVEDSKADLFLIREAIEATKIDAALHVVQDGEQALQFFDQASGGAEGPCPDLVLLDLNLPKRDGIEVLRYMRDNCTCRNALVLVVSSSDSVSDREVVKSLGFNGYFRKPSAYAEFMQLGAIVSALLATTPGTEKA